MFGRTIRELLMEVYQYGTDPKTIKKHGAPAFVNPSMDEHLSLPPKSPMDLFAGMAHILDVTGAYTLLIASKNKKNTPKGCHPILPRTLVVINKAAEEWKKSVLCPQEVLKEWKELQKHFDKRLFITPSSPNKRAPIPSWLGTVFKLLAIADTACSQVGYMPAVEASYSTSPMKIATALLNAYPNKNPRSRKVLLHRQVPTMTSVVNWEVVCVQPKAKTPSVGCGLRNLTQSLALLPSRSKISVSWIVPQVKQKLEERSELNLLLIPFPYRMDETAIVTNEVEDTTAGNPWGWFEVHQQWLPPTTQMLCDYVRELVATANESHLIGGVVFPEYSLNYATYEAIAEMLRDDFAGVEFLISGSNGNCAGEEGNFALGAHFHDVKNDDGTVGERMMMVASRPKHHRWALTDSQIKEYNLEGRFENHTSKHFWWENIPLTSRELHIHPLASGSVFSVLICEDLARSEPVHDPLKAIGPNLVFVLLFDGSQEDWRWSSRYSSGLSEDPGSSVVTLTSRALIEREGKEAEGCIGIWKEPGKRSEIIKCPQGTDAVVLRLRGEAVKESTVDGRTSQKAFTWTMLKGPAAVKLDRSKFKNMLETLGAIAK